MEHNCPICGKKIYNHLGACYSCRDKLEGNKNPGGISSGENNKAIGAILLIAVAGLFLWFAYNSIRSLGFNHNSAIAIMVAIPLIILILIFRGKKIYWALRSLSQDKSHKEKYKKENRKGFIWLSVIVLLLIIVLFFQFSPLVSIYVFNSIINSEKNQAENPFNINPSDYQKACEESCGGNLNINTYGPAQGTGYYVSDYGDSGKHVLICECSMGMKMINLD